MRPFRRPRRPTIVAMSMPAGIAAVVSYPHMYELALRHDEPERHAVLFPLPVDGVLVARSATSIRARTPEPRRARTGLPATGSALGHRPRCGLGTDAALSPVRRSVVPSSAPPTRTGFTRSFLFMFALLFIRWPSVLTRGDRGPNENAR